MDTFHNGRRQKAQNSGVVGFGVVDVLRSGRERETVEVISFHHKRKDVTIHSRGMVAIGDSRFDSFLGECSDSSRHGGARGQSEQRREIARCVLEKAFLLC